MRIKITSDSTCDLNNELLTANDISLSSLIVIKDDKEYYDGETITPADIFDHVANGGSLCSTAARSVGYYQEFFEKFSSEYDGVVHISIGSGFSSSYQNARLAAEEFDNVRVIDSQSLSSGQGFIVLEAAKLAKTCTSLEELEKQLIDFTSRVEISFVLDRLDYMVKGGRCSAAAALGANLLNLKPCIEVKDGKLGVVKKYRGNYNKCLQSYIKDRLEGRDNLGRELIFVTSTPVSEEAYAAVMNSVASYGKFDSIIETTAGCTVSCHCGPGTLGIIFVRN